MTIRSAITPSLREATEGTEQTLASDLSMNDVVFVESGKVLGTRALTQLALHEV